MLPEASAHGVRADLLKAGWEEAAPGLRVARDPRDTWAKAQRVVGADPGV